ncbi:uncharacterized protein [Hyperolius riggenbachi]|uniref:uncharacterized protein n=1 Tax=Hyperolius riggenbachi TaxID=752182 RepID=UPI0035A34622
MDAKQGKREFITNFIALYRRHPCLWKYSSPEHSDREMSNRAYEELVDFYRTVHPAATVKTVKRKIQSLLAGHRRHLNKVMALKRSGAGAAEVYANTVWYFRLLEFTVDEVEPRRSVSTIHKKDGLDNKDKEDGLEMPEQGEHLQVAVQEETCLAWEPEQVTSTPSTSSRPTTSMPVVPDYRASSREWTDDVSPEKEQAMARAMQLLQREDDQFDLFWKKRGS